MGWSTDPINLEGTAQNTGSWLQFCEDEIVAPISYLPPGTVGVDWQITSIKRILDEATNKTQPIRKAWFTIQGPPSPGCLFKFRAAEFSEVSGSDPRDRFLKDAWLQGNKLRASIWFPDAEFAVPLDVQLTLGQVKSCD